MRAGFFALSTVKYHTGRFVLPSCPVVAQSAKSDLSRRSFSEDGSSKKRCLTCRVVTRRAKPEALAKGASVVKLNLRAIILIPKTLL